MCISDQKVKEIFWVIKFVITKYTVTLKNKSRVWGGYSAWIKL